MDSIPSRSRTHTVRPFRAEIKDLHVRIYDFYGKEVLDSQDVYENAVLFAAAPELQEAALIAARQPGMPQDVKDRLYEAINKSLGVAEYSEIYCPGCEKQRLFRVESQARTEAETTKMWQDRVAPALEANRMAARAREAAGGE